MINVDLVTGFLGSGKTTFIKKYVRYLADRGEKIGIIENDFGAINIDVLLLDEVSEACIVEQVVGGINRAEWSRRFKSKLIAMSMRGLTRVIIEPSGIFEPEWFFDVLYEDHICDIYKADRVITLVDYNTEIGENPQADYLMATQLVAAGNVLITKASNTPETKTKITEKLNNLLISQGTKKQILAEFSPLNFEGFVFGGYSTDEIPKKFFSSADKLMACFVMNSPLKEEEQITAIKEILNDEQYGRVLRLKGYIKSADGFYQINATRDNIMSEKTGIGQEVLIFIGTTLNEEKINNRFKTLS